MSGSKGVFFFFFLILNKHTTSRREEMFKYGYNCTQHQTFSPGRYLSCCSYVVHTKSNVNSCVRVMSRIKK